MVRAIINGITPAIKRFRRSRGLIFAIQASTEIGAIITPPMPAFYHKPKTIDDIVNQTVGRVLDILRVDHPDLFKRWTRKEGMGK